MEFVFFIINKYMGKIWASDIESGGPILTIDGS